MRLTALAAGIALCCTFPQLASAQKNKKTPEEIELKKLRTENNLAKAKLTKKLAALKAQKDELDAKHRLSQKQADIKLAALGQEKKRLALQNSIAKARYTSSQSKADYALSAQLAKMKREVARLKATNNLEAQKMRVGELQQRRERNRINAELNKMKLRNMKLKQEQTELRHKVARYNYALQWRQKRKHWKTEANNDPTYLLKPFDRAKKRLTVSDRRIPLNGPIISGVADYVTGQIHYYNNIDSKKPIFIMIDKCPGGSVMEGYRIVKAMQASKAPIHVVVKSFAASMAAVITTLADHSYAYPNAIILHHQMSTWQRGNMTQLAEQLKMAKEWERRLMGPVTRKLGISIKQFRSRMYKNNSNGDWEEFANRAKQLKWVQNIVHEIRETGMLKKPNKPRRRFRFFFGSMKEKRDKMGNRYVEMPRLHPYDLYYIHNKDNYYR